MKTKFIDKDEELKNKLFTEVSSKKVMDEFFHLVNEALEMNLTFDYTVDETKQAIDFTSKENLADTNRAFAIAWKEVYVTNFNRGKVVSDYLKKTHEMECKFTIDIAYHIIRHDNGFNYTRFGYATYDGEKWLVNLERDRKY